MPIVSEKLNIYEFPAQFIKENCAEVTLGDLHGNPLKLIHSLFHYRIIQFNDSVTDKHKKYHEFVTLYEKMGELFAQIKPQLAKNEVVSPELMEQLRALHQQFLQWLTCIEKGSNNTLFRLIGDEVADRGYNDYLTLKLIELIINLNTEVKIIASNHGMQFIYAYERLFVEGAPLELNALNMGREFISSLTGLNIYLQTGIISKEELKNLIDDYYIPHVLLLDDHVERNTRIYIYTHAPNHFHSITELAKRLDIDIPELHSAPQWSALINAMNNTFFRLLEKYQVSNFLQLEAFRDQTPNNPVALDPVVKFIENRWDVTQENNLAQDMKKRQGLMQFVLICGHDKCNSAYIKSLDSDGGKISLDAVMSTIFVAVNTVINNYPQTAATDILIHPFETFYNPKEQFNFYSNYCNYLNNELDKLRKEIENLINTSYNDSASKEQLKNRNYGFFKGKEVKLTALIDSLEVLYVSQKELENVSSTLNELITFKSYTHKKAHRLEHYFFHSSPIVDNSNNSNTLSLDPQITRSGG